MGACTGASTGLAAATLDAGGGRGLTSTLLFFGMMESYAYSAGWGPRGDAVSGMASPAEVKRGTADTNTPTLQTEAGADTHRGSPGW